MTDSGGESALQARARALVLTVVAQGLAEFAEDINTGPHRFAEVSTDPEAGLGRTTITIYHTDLPGSTTSTTFFYTVHAYRAGPFTLVESTTAPALVDGDWTSVKDAFELPGTRSRDWGRITSGQVHAYVRGIYERVMRLREAAVQE
jgi:hypothetical protein